MLAQDRSWHVPSRRLFTAARIMQLFHHLLSAAQFKIKIPTPQEAWPLV